ncbi:MAG: alpha-2-macroglobulin family protein, partial [Syntrophothermus sp.]
MRDETEKLLLASLERSEELKRIPASEFADLIVKGNYYGYKFRPTLYDMLSHQVLNCFRSGFFDFDRFEKSTPDNPGLLGTAEEFLSAVNGQKDSSFIKNDFVRILRDLTSFHLKDTRKEELGDIDLMRLDFFRWKFSGSNRDSLYLNTLYKLLRYYKGSLSSSRIFAALASFYKQLPYNWNNPDDFKNSLNKALALCDSAIVNFPNSFGAKESEVIKNDILEKYLLVNTEGTILPGETFRVLVTCRNLNKVYFRIIEDALVKSDTIHRDVPSLIDFFRKIRPFKIFEQTFPDLNDYHTHKYDVFMPPLPVGRYVILASADSNFSDRSGFTFYQGIYVTNLSAIVKPEDDNLKLFVLDRKSGKPLKDVNVEPRNVREPIRLKTDKNGCADLFPYPQRISILLYSEKDTFKIYNYDGYESGNEYQYKYYGETVFFFDREIYRPGQTLFFKGISLLHNKRTGEYEAWEGRKVKVTLNDANGRVVHELELETNDYGSFSGQFDLPENVLPGSWSISDGYSSKDFRVEEYKRPQFEVMLDKIKGEHYINDEIWVTGSAQAYSGAPMSGAEVKFRVLRTPVVYYGGRKYRPGFLAGDFSSIASGSVKAGIKGEFSFSFKALGDPRDKAEKMVYSYYINAEVIDRTGESHRADTRVMAGDAAILADIHIPEVVVKGETQKYDVATADLNGNFLPAEVKISVFRLKVPDRVFRTSPLEKPDTNLVSKDEYYRIFSHDAYRDEQNFTNWEKEKLVLDTSFVSVENMSLEGNVFRKLAQGKYYLILSAKDKNGKQAEMIRYFTLLDPKAKTIPLNDALWFHPLKTSVEPGEDLEVSIGTALNDMTILFEIESKGKLSERKWLQLSNEQRLLKIPIEDEYRGYINLHCLAIWNNSVYSFTKEVNVPWSNKKLKLELETFRNKITPGETETWKIRVKDETGHPAESEVLAAMYDQSLDGLGYSTNWEFNIFNDNYNSYWWNTQNSFPAGCFHSIGSSSYWYYKESPRIIYNELFYFGLAETGNIMYGSFGKFKSKTYESSQFKMSPFSEWIPILGTIPNVPKDNANVVKVKELKEEAFTFRGGRMDALAYSLGDLNNSANKKMPGLSSSGDQNKLMNVITRKNFSETAFFFPHLITDDEGMAEFSFKVPEALTKWKFMAFAHTEDLSSGMLTSTAISQKQMMVQSLPPRFFRENDTIWLTARVSNLTDSILSGQVRLMSFDAGTMQAADASLGNENPLQELRLEPKETKAFKWKLTIPEGKYNSVRYRISAICGNYSDGEENLIPVLGNRTLITESLPLPVLGSENRSFIFENLKNDRSTSLKNYKLTLEFTSNPAFLAFQALPSLMGYSFESADNIFNSYYAASIAMHIANSYPGFKKVFDSWKASGKETLASNLQKNQELKN